MNQNEKISLILNPLRIRILGTFTMGSMTVSDLALFLDDVPRATLYRHVNLLVEAGFLVPVRSIRKRGTLEYRYQLFQPEYVDDAKKDMIRLLLLLGKLLGPEKNSTRANRICSKRVTLPENSIDAFSKEVNKIVEKYHQEEEDGETFFLECFMTRMSMPHEDNG